MNLPHVSLSFVCLTVLLPAQSLPQPALPQPALPQAALPQPALPQPAQSKAAQPQGTSTAPVAAEQLLHRAFWLERVDRKTSEAVKTYRAFLAAAPKHEHAPRAAAYALGLLRRSGDRAAAESFQKAFAAQLERAPSETQDNGRAQRGGFGGRFGGGRGGRGQGGDRGQGGAGFGRRQGGRFGSGASPEERAALEARIPRIEERIAKAKKAGDDRIAARYEGILERVRSELSGTPGQNRGRQRRGNAAGGLQGTIQSLTARMPVRLTAMTAEQRAAFVTRYGEVADQLVASLKEAGRAGQATQLAATTLSIRKLIDEQKFAEAQAAIDALQQRVRNAR